jgi:hypothetical protein
MSEDPPFSGDRAEFDDPGAARGGGDPPFETEDAFGDSFGAESESPPQSPASFGTGQLQMGWQMARTWIKQHQEASMLGAFAVGVFVGAYVRD